MNPDLRERMLQDQMRGTQYGQAAAQPPFPQGAQASLSQAEDQRRHTRDISVRVLQDFLIRAGLTKEDA